MKLIEKPLKVSYTNPIKDWYEENKTNTPIKDEGVSYENGMFISINNSKCFYSDLVKDFKYRPKTSVKSGVQKFVEWYLDYYSND